MYNTNRSSAHSKVLAMEDIARLAPSVFATAPKEDRSKNYRFFPTHQVVQALIDEGFQPVSAKQSKTRDESNREFTRHILRFRHSDFMKEMQNQLVAGTHNRIENAPEIPEIVLLNSHNGTSSYQIDLGFYRLVCSNGLMVCSGNVDSVRVRHSGHENIVQEVLEGSFKIIDEAPKAITQIAEWKATKLKREEQEAFASTALEFRDTSLQIPADRLLHERRYADQREINGERDLWKTMNVVQENLIRGGVRGLNANNQLRRVRGVQSVDGDTKLNRALWSLTEKMGQLKKAA